MSCGNFFWFWFVLKQPTHSNASANFRHSLGIQMAWHRGGLHNGRGLRLQDSKFSCSAITVFRRLSKKTRLSPWKAKTHLGPLFLPNDLLRILQHKMPKLLSYQQELNSQTLTHQSIGHFNRLKKLSLAGCQQQIASVRVFHWNINFPNPTINWLIWIIDACFLHYKVHNLHNQNKMPTNIQPKQLETTPQHSAPSHRNKRIYVSPCHSLLGLLQKDRSRRNPRFSQEKKGQPNFPPWRLQRPQVFI